MNLLDEFPLPRSPRPADCAPSASMHSIAFLALVLGVLACFFGVHSTPLDDYVWKYDENYKWVDMVLLAPINCSLLFSSLSFAIL